MIDPMAKVPGAPRYISRVPEGLNARLTGVAAREDPLVLHIVPDDVRLTVAEACLRFFHPDIEVLTFPAWDTVPYDRTSPRGDILARRVDTLARLGRRQQTGPQVVLATVAAVLQRVPPRRVMAESAMMIREGSTLKMESLAARLTDLGYRRVEEVAEAGEYAVRGGLLDIYAAGYSQPLRLDFFGDEVETIRTFAPETQRSTGQEKAFLLKPAGEILLREERISRFRRKYRALFGSPAGEDPLYSSISEGRPFPGMEQWLPLFYENPETLFDYLPDSVPVFIDAAVDDAVQARRDQILEYFEARRARESGHTDGDAPVYHPLPPTHLYLDQETWQEILNARRQTIFYPYDLPEELEATAGGGGPGRDFTAQRKQPDGALISTVAEHLHQKNKEGKRCLVAAYGPGPLKRIHHMLADSEAAPPLEDIENAEELAVLPEKTVGMTCLGLAAGFETDTLCVLTEQDIFGDRLQRPTGRPKKAANFIADISALEPGDLVVHSEHGIGRYEGLETIQAGGAPHDCARLVYSGGDYLFVPVENIEVLSRYGSEQAGVQLDRLGGAGWQARKARLKKRIREMAEKLVQTAAAREIGKTEVLTPPSDSYESFCARFPFPETEDQNRAITETLQDLGAGRPMDRLVCGDVGFGKTEIALRASFTVAMNGLQVALVVPTTLLARQHYETFCERFAGFPVRIGVLSRLTSTRDAETVRREMMEGGLDIVIGTHALLSSSVEFARLGLLVVDEEQHFGVAHKEKLKSLKKDVHVLTLTATPIPRTLQLALGGVREMSVIATPPVDRLAVRTFVIPLDGVMIREALIRERYRGGQSFVVCPRVRDISDMQTRLENLVPELKVAVAHGRLSGRRLEDVMSAFAQGKYDVLLSTHIIESGLDLPRVNTLIVHRADMFGLAQLYQIRGRVGRGKVRAYAYLTTQPNRALTSSAEKRLQVLQKLDSLGAGFSLASHDLDIRGAGNLLGDEQSGHIREVGVELYQHMLEEAVAAVRRGDHSETADTWSPELSLGLPVRIPETYVADRGVRLSLYRRIADLSDSEGVENMEAELRDRFGPLPMETRTLLEIVRLKEGARRAGVEKIEAGPRGGVVSFRENRVPNPQGLVAFITDQPGTVKLRPDHKLVYQRNWEVDKERLDGVRYLVRRLVKIAQEGDAL